LAADKKDFPREEEAPVRLAASDPYLAEGLAATEEKIAYLLGADVPFVAEVLHYAAGSGGKRFRPRLTLLSAATAGMRQAAVADLAACVECVHLATLLHDDVIDEAPTRRGRPTTRRHFGNNLSILGGDYILTRVFQYIANEIENRDILPIFCTTTNRMVAGEFLAMWRQARLDIAEEEYLKIITLKSAHLIEASCRVGALAAGCDGPELQALTDYGLNTGISFQITDDCLDFSAEAGAWGKEEFVDVRSGKITLPIIMSLKSPRGRAVAAAVEAIWEGQPAEDELVGMLDEVDAFGQARERARRYAETGKEALAAVPAGTARDLLADIADWTWQRSF
jgi:octaprenyl-diphosphate synthase